jgi:hypothetical protein
MLKVYLDLLDHSPKHLPQKLPRWANVEQKLTILCDRHADEEWARELQVALKRWLDATSSSLEYDAIEIANAFAVFHHACLFRFFEVDKHLINLCIEVTNVAAPLNILLSVI